MGKGYFGVLTVARRFKPSSPAMRQTWSPTRPTADVDRAASAHSAWPTRCGRTLAWAGRRPDESERSLRLWLLLLDLPGGRHQPDMDGPVEGRGCQSPRRPPRPDVPQQSDAP